MKKSKFALCLLSLIVVISMMLSGCNDQGGSDGGKKDDEKVYSNEVQVVLLLGQSNAEGHTHAEYLTKTVGADKAKEYQKGYDNVKISYNCTLGANTNNGVFSRVKIGQGTNVSRFGPEVGIAEKISVLDPIKPVYIIKFAYGGTTLTTNWRSPSSKNTGNLYQKGLEFILEQLGKLEREDLYPVVKAVCWMQGESDSTSNDYNSYKKLEENFVKDLREALAYYKDPSSEIGFIDAGISDSIAWTQYKVINQAKRELALEGEGHVYLDTIEANLRYNGEPAGAPDIYHYDSASMIKLGNMFADSLIENFLEV